MYSGHVEAGGSAAVRRLPAVTITKVAVGTMDNDAYLLRCAATGRQGLIDAAAEPDRLLELAGDSGLDVVITTHQHRDHWAALAEVVAATGALHAAHPLDAEGIDVPVDIPLAGGGTILIGEVTLEAVHITGHTPGSIALVYDDPEGHPHAFTGDCLFPGGVGATWGDTERFTSLLDGVITGLFDRYPDETWVYPGHGDDTTLGAERPHLRDWRARGW